MWNGTDVAVKRLWWDSFDPDGSGRERNTVQANDPVKDPDCQEGQAGVDCVASGTFGTPTIVVDQAIDPARVNDEAAKPRESTAHHFSFEEFEREVDVLTNLRLPNIVLFLGACRTPPNMCLVMEYCPRGSMDKLIHNSDVQLDRYEVLLRLSFVRRTLVYVNTLYSGRWRTLRMAIHAARGMQYLHSQQPAIVHRDLKPGNLLVGANYEIKVCDFGLSRNTFQTQRVTAASHQVGTPGYIAPEILRDDQYRYAK